MLDIVAPIRAWNSRRLKKRRLQQISVKPKDKKLAVLGIVKNEELNIEEWVAHYLWQGADTIFVIDNGSEDSTVEKLAPWIQNGAVRLIELPERHKQVLHYRTAIRHFEIEKTYEWLLIADSDEFWFCKNGDKLRTALDEYAFTDLIYVNWTIFGDGGHDRHPNGLRRSLIHRRPELGAHRDAKWICRTDRLNGGKNITIHKVENINSRRVISDNQRFQINHYMTQSRQYFFQVKARRGSASSPRYDNVRNESYFNHFSKVCTVEDTLLVDQLAGRTKDVGSRFGLAEPVEAEV